MDVTAFIARFDIAFNNTELLVQALTHRSYTNETDEAIEHNERLEFLGDAVLDFVAGSWLYERFPDMREGNLTRLRSSLVCTENLAEFALKTGIDQLIRLGHGEEDNGGRERLSTLCATFEAVVGAIYLDQGMEAVREFVLPLFEPSLAEILRQVSIKDAKSRLQEWSQSQPEKHTPLYAIIAATGPDHLPWFTVEVSLGDESLAWGSGRSKRSAEQAAAQTALENLEISDPPPKTD